MKYLFLFSVVLLSCASGNSSGTEVYICISKNAEVYHLDNKCHGLQKCTHEIKKVSIEEAKSTYKRRLCGFED